MLPCADERLQEQAHLGGEALHSSHCCRSCWRVSGIGALLCSLQELQGGCLEPGVLCLAVLPLLLRAGLAQQASQQSLQAGSWEVLGLQCRHTHLS